MSRPIRKLARKLRKGPEAALVLLGCVTLPLLPRCCILGLSVIFGRAAYLVSGKLRRIALENLELAFGRGRSPAEKRAIARQAFETFALTTLDLFWFGWFSRRRIGRYVHRDESYRHLDENRPAVLVTAHLGNWEVMGQAASLWGEQLLSVAMPIRNSLADRILNSLRSRLGQQVQARAGAVRALLKALKQGSSVALLLDQNTLPDEGGVFVPFFGREVPVSRAPALLAMRSGRTVIPASCVHTGGGHYLVSVYPEVTIDSGDDRAATQAILRRVEILIREQPGRWLWMYKRWKYIPDEQEGDGYPSYAHRIGA